MQPSHHNITKVVLDESGPYFYTQESMKTMGGLSIITTTTDIDLQDHIDIEYMNNENDMSIINTTNKINISNVTSNLSDSYLSLKSLPDVYRLYFAFFPGFEDDRLPLQTSFNTGLFRYYIYHVYIYIFKLF